MSTQLFPPGLQRSHRYVKTIGWSPVHVPGFAVSTCPLAGVVSEIVGRAVLAGATSAAAGEFGAAYASAMNATAAATATSAGRPRRRMKLLCMKTPLSGRADPSVVPRTPHASQRDPSFYESLTAPLRYSPVAMTSLDLRRMRLRSGEQRRERHDVSLGSLTFGGQRYLPVPEKPDGDLTITRAATGTVFDLRFTGRLHGPCHRCLGDAVIDRRIVTQEYQATNPDTDELRTPYIVGDLLDLS